MAQKELQMACKRLLLKINFITGWPLYDDPEDQAILEEQFTLKLKESYPYVNCDEIEFAFRNNTSVKDWGKNINLAMIDEVMIPYLEKRAEASKVEEQVKMKNLPQPEPEEVTEEDILEIAQGCSSYNWKLIPKRAYSILSKQGKLNLTEEEKTQIRASVNLELNKMAAEDKNLFTHTSRESMFDTLCKQLSVGQFFKNKI